MIKINLILNFYLNEHRKEEILFCLDKNLQNENINRIILFVDKYYDIPIKYRENEKIAFFDGYNRPTFKTIFKYINFYMTNSWHDDDIFILSNCDIFFDDTLKLINPENLNDAVYALTRWEFDGKTSSRYIGWDYSQDSWIWKGRMKLENIEVDFSLGKPGCDNRLAYELSKSYKVINPCKSIRSHHYHINPYRGYRPGDVNGTIPEPYLCVVPTKL